MGTCIWAYESGKPADEAGTFLADVFEHYSAVDSIGFMTGFAGIGWGVEYLVQHRFMEADTDEILEDIDDALFRLRRQRKKLYEPGENFFEYGLYFLSRTKGGDPDNDALALTKRAVLAFLVEECERMFPACRSGERTIPEVNVAYLNSVVYFLSEVYRLGVCPQKARSVLRAVVRYYPVWLQHNAPSVAEITTSCLLGHIGKRDDITDEACAGLQCLVGRRIAELKELPRTAISRLGWDMLFYKDIFTGNGGLPITIAGTNGEMASEPELLGVKFYRLFAE